MADNDLQAELDNLLGGLDEKQAPAEEQKEAPAAVETPVADSATSTGSAAPRKGMLGGGKPMGKGKLGAGVATSRPAAGNAGATSTRPAAGTAPAASAHPATGSAPAVNAARPAAANPPTTASAPVPSAYASSPKSKPSVVPLILSGLSLVFTLVAIMMITQLNSSVKELQKSITASFKEQKEETSKQIKALNDQTQAVKNIQKTLKTQMLDRESDLQKNLHMLSDSLAKLKEKLDQQGKK